jgi:hypothetical protein
MDDMLQSYFNSLMIDYYIEMLWQKLDRNRIDPNKFSRLMDKAIEWKRLA